MFVSPHPEGFQLVHQVQRFSWLLLVPANSTTYHPLTFLYRRRLRVRLVQCGCKEIRASESEAKESDSGHRCPTHRQLNLLVSINRLRIPGHACPGTPGRQGAAFPSHCVEAAPEAAEQMQQHPRTATKRTESGTGAGPVRSKLSGPSI